VSHHICTSEGVDSLFRYVFTCPYCSYVIKFPIEGGMPDITPGAPGVSHSSGGLAIGETAEAVPDPEVRHD